MTWRPPLDRLDLPERVARPLERIAFWSAIWLAFCSIVLVVRGFETSTDVVVFVGVLVANAIALVGGHGYQPRTDGAFSRRDRSLPRRSRSETQHRDE